MIIVITGPTCLGKSETALHVASLINAEIVNADAFQIYKELDIGVNKPPKEYFSKVPHHLFSFVEPSKSYSIKDYQSDLRKCLDDIFSRNKNVVIVGGSGLYIRSSLYDYEFKENEPIDMSRYLGLDNESLHKELELIDPEQAKIIHLNNRKRVLRAIEIYLQNNKTKSEIISEQKHSLIYKDTYFFVKSHDREVLYDNINKRVDLMMKKGLLNEVKSLYEKYGDVQALQAIGYKEFIPYFKGETSLDNVIEEIKKHTRNYAKRQMTYIRHQFPVIFYNNEEDILKVIKK